MTPTPRTPKTTADESPSAAASRYQQLRSHLAELKLAAAAEALPAVLEQATAITPGLESPTIAPLADPDWVAVRAMVPRRDVNTIMDQLSAIGAKAILATEIRFCRF